MFHVYRHLRRRENTRQQYISEEAEKEEKDRDFQERAAALKEAAAQRTAKKREKRFVQVVPAVWNRFSYLEFGELTIR